MDGRDTVSGAVGGDRASDDDRGIRRVADRVAAERLCADILRAERVYPIVGLSCTYRGPAPPLSPRRVRERIWPTVPIYIIESREARLLSELLPNGLGAYNGAARIWLPGVDQDSEARWHPLIYDSTGEYGQGALDRLAEEFTLKAPETPADLSPEERTVLHLRSLPRPHEGSPSKGRLVPLATRKDLRRLTTDLRSADRDYPIVVVAVGSQGEGAAAAGEARSLLDSHVPIYVLGSDDLRRRLVERLPAELGLGEGEARIIWPDAFAEHVESAHHPSVAVGLDNASGIVAALELSRPTVRRHVAALEERLAVADERAARSRAELTDARLANQGLERRADTAEARALDAEQHLEVLAAAGLDAAELAVLATLDRDGQLHRLISREWLKSNPTPAERRAAPLRYVFGPGFVGAVDELVGTTLNRITWVAAMVACGRAKEVAGIDPHHFRERRAGSSAQLVRADGAKAWTCKLNGEGASRLGYWILRDGVVEFGSVGVHDSITLLA